MATFFSVSNGNLTDSGVFARSIELADKYNSATSITIPTVPTAPIPFLANSHQIHSVAVHLSARAPSTTSTLILEISSLTGLVATETYDINLFTAYSGDNNIITVHPQNWQLLQLTSPLSVVEGNTYLITLKASDPDQISLMGEMGAYDAVTSLPLSSVGDLSFNTPFLNSNEQTFDLSNPRSSIVDLSEKQYHLGLDDFTVEGHFSFTLPPSSSWIPLINFGNGWGTGFSSSWGLTYNSAEGVFYFWRFTKRGEAFVKFKYPAASIANKVWYHIAVTRKNNKFTLWVDGVSIGTQVEKIINFNKIKGARLQIGFFNKLGLNINAKLCVSNVRITKNISLYEDSFSKPTDPLSDRLNTSILYRSPNDTTYRVCDSTGVQTLSTFNIAAEVINDANGSIFAPRGTALNTLETTDPFPTSNEYSLNLDGSTYYITTDTYGTFITGNFTAEAWVKPSTVTGTKQLWVYSTDANTSLHTFAHGVDIVNGQVFGWVVSGPTLPVKLGMAVGTIAADVWTHIAVVRDSTSLITYINGVAQTPVTISSKINSPLNCKLKIGGEDFNKLFYSGKISNLRFTNGAALYTSNFDITSPAGGADIVSPVPLEVIESEISYTGELTSPLKVVDITELTTQYNTFNSASLSDDTPFVTSDEKSLALIKASSQYLQTNKIGPDAAAIDLGFADFTIECWIKLASIPTGALWPGLGEYYCIYSAASPNVNDGFRVILDSTYIFVIGANQDLSPFYKFTHTFNANQWYHIAFTRKQGLLTFFKDGVSVGSTDFSVNAGTGSQLTIGRNLDTTRPANFNGNISNLRIIRGTALYTSNFNTTPVAGGVNIQSPEPLDAFISPAGTPGEGFVNTVGVLQSSINSPYIPSTLGESIFFDGETYITFVSKNNFQFLAERSFTVQMWVNLQSVSKKQILFATYGTYKKGSSQYDSNWATSNLPLILTCEANGKVGAVTSVLTDATIAVDHTGGSLSANTWHHIAYVRDVVQRKAFLYLDGVVVATITPSSFTSAAQWNSNTRAYIGSSNLAFTPIGYISGLHVLNGVAQHPTPKPTAPPTALPTGTMLGGTLAGTPVFLVENSVTDRTLTAINGEVISDDDSFNGSTSTCSLTSGYIEVPKTVVALDSADFCIESFVYLYPAQGLAQYRTILHAAGAGAPSRSNCFMIISAGTDGSIPDGTPARRTKYIVWMQLSVGTSGYNPKFASVSDVTYNTWNHIALTRTKNVFKLFVNGVLESSVIMPDGGSFNTAGNWYLGGQTTANRWLNGKIASFRVVKGSSVYTRNFNNPGPITESGIVLNNATQSTDSPFPGTDGSIVFSGTASYAHVPPISDVDLLTGDFTIEFWGKFPTTGNVYGDRILTIGSSNNAASLQLIFGNSGIDARFISLFAGVGSTYWVNNTTKNINDNQWHHLAITRNGNALRLFIDGNQIGATYTGAAVLSNGAAQGMYIGGLAGASSFTTFSLSNLRIVKGTALYIDTFTKPESPLSLITNTTLLYQAPYDGTYSIPETTQATGGAILSPLTAATQTSNTLLNIVSKDSPVTTDGSDSYFFNGKSPLTVSKTLLAIQNSIIEFWVTPTDRVLREQIWLDVERESIYYSTFWKIGCTATRKVFLVAGGPRIGANGTPDIYWATYTSADACINYDATNHIVVARNDQQVAVFVNGVRQIFVTIPRAGGWQLGGFQAATRAWNWSVSPRFVVGRTLVGFMGKIHIRDFGAADVNVVTAPPNVIPTAVTPSTVMLWEPPSKTFIRYAAQTTVFGTKMPSPFANDTSVLLNSNKPSSFTIMPVDNILNQTHPFTVECWFNIWAWPSTTGTIDSECIFGKTIANQFAVGLDTVRERICLSVATEKDAGVGSTTVLFDTWYHIAVTYDATNTFRVYLNGKLEILFKNTKPGLANYQLDNSGIRVGYGMNGYVSNFRISDTVMYTEVGGRITVPTAPLQVTSSTVALYKSPYTKYIYNEQRPSLLIKPYTAVQSSNTPFAPGVDGSLDTGVPVVIEPTFSPDLNIDVKDFVIEWWENITSFKEGYFPVIFFGAMTNVGCPLCVFYDTNGTRLMVNSTPITLPAVPALNVWRYRALVRSAGKITLYSGTLGGSATQERSVAFAADIPQVLNQGYIGAAVLNGGTRIHDGFLSNIRLSSNIEDFTNTVPAAPFDTTADTLFLYKAPYNSSTFSSKSTVRTNALVKVDSPVAFETSPYSKEIYDCMFFNKSTYVKIADQVPELDLGANRTPFTVEVWVYLLDNTSQYILTRGGGTWEWNVPRGISYMLAVDGKDRFCWFAAANEVSVHRQKLLGLYAGKVSSCVRKWTHLAVSYDGTTTKLFVNGKRVTGEQYNINGTYNYSTNNKWSFRLGKKQGESKNINTTNMLGYMSNLRIVNNTCLYTNNFTVPVGQLSEINSTALLLKTPYPSNEFLSYPSPFSTEAWAVDRVGFNDKAMFLKTANPIPAMPGTFTIEFWFNYSRSNNTKEYFIDGRLADSSQPFLIGININKPNTLHVHAGPDGFVDCGNISANVWYHVAIVRNQKNIANIYIDGNICGYIVTSAPWGGNTLMLGKKIGVTPANFLGYLSNLRIVAGEEVYTTSFAKPTAPFNVNNNTAFLLKPSLNLDKHIITTETAALDNNIEPQTYNDCISYNALNISSPWGNGYKDFVRFHYNHLIEYLETSEFDLYQKPFVIEMWIYNTRPSQQDEVIAESGSQTLLYNNNLVIYLDYKNNIVLDVNGAISSFIEVPAYEWTHLAFVCTSTTSDYDIDLFVDGEKCFTWKKKISPYTSLSKILFGGRLTGGSYPNPFFGYMAGIRIVTGEVSREVSEINNRNILSTTGIQVVSDSPNSLVPGSMYFDNSTKAYVTTPATENFKFLSDFTVELWFKTDVALATRASSTLLHCWSYTLSRGWKIYVHPDNSISFATSQFTLRTGADIILNNEWTHLSISRAESEILIHINGEVVYTHTFSGPIDQLNGIRDYISSANLEIGESRYPYIGYITDVRISSNARYARVDFEPEYPLINDFATVFLQKVGNAVTNSFINSYTAESITVPTEPPAGILGTKLLIQSPHNVFNGFAYIMYNADINFNPITLGESYYFSGAALDINSRPYFDGIMYTGIRLYADSRLSVANQPFILEMWIKPEISTSTQQTLIHKSGEYILYLDRNDFLWFKDGRSVSVKSTAKVTRDTWTYITITGTGTAVSMFINTNLQASATTTVPVVTLSSLFYIGTTSEVTGPYKGSISDIRLIKGRSLTSVTVPTTSPETTVDTVLNISSVLYSSPKYRVFPNTSISSLTPVSPFNTTDKTLSFQFNQDITIPAKTEHDISGVPWGVEFWVYPHLHNAMTYNQYIVYKGDATKISYAVYLNSAKNVVFKTKQSIIGTNKKVTVVEKTLTGTTPILPLRWSHIAITSDGTNTQLYINGAWIITGGFAANVNNTSALTIGKNPQSQYEGFCGFISNLKITKNDALYDSGVVVPVEAFAEEDTTDPDFNNVSLLLHMDGDNNSTTFLDSSINAFSIVPIFSTKLKTADFRFGNSSVFFYGGEVIDVVCPRRQRCVSTFVSHGSGLIVKTADGSSDITSAGNFGLQDFTIEFFIKPATGRHNLYPIIDIAGAKGLEIYYTSTQLIVNGGGKQLIGTSAGVWTLNTWRHVAVVRSGTTLRVYINGIQAGKAVFALNFTNGFVTIGTHNSNRQHGMYGYLDELRITKNVCRYNNSFIPPTSPLDTSSTTSLLIQSPYTYLNYYMAGAGSVHISSLILNSTRTDITVNVTQDSQLPNIFIHNRGTLSISASNNVTLDVVGENGLQITSDGRLNIN